MWEAFNYVYKASSLLLLSDQSTWDIAIEYDVDAQLQRL